VHNSAVVFDSHKCSPLNSADPEAELNNAMSYARIAASESSQRAADAVARCVCACVYLFEYTCVHLLCVGLFLMFLC
jgi:hypothetical protein